MIKVRLQDGKIQVAFRKPKRVKRETSPWSADDLVGIGIFALLIVTVVMAACVAGDRITTRRDVAAEVR